MISKPARRPHYLTFLMVLESRILSMELLRSFLFPLQISFLRCLFAVAPTQAIPQRPWVCPHKTSHLNNAAELLWLQQESQRAGKSITCWNLVWCPRWFYSQTGRFSLSMGLERAMQLSLRSEVRSATRMPIILCSIFIFLRGIMLIGFTGSHRLYIHPLHHSANASAMRVFLQQILHGCIILRWLWHLKGNSSY